jgi:CO/xanthine dehydrogenase Mo-binding subunit
MPNSTNQQNGTQSAAPKQQQGTAQDAPNKMPNDTKPAIKAAAPAPQKPLVTAQTPPNKKRLVGENYSTPDLIAKVTGQSKYAEDYRADGMLFTKLLLSPYPHARVLHIDASRALAMPGVKGILTMDDLPAPADSVTDLGVVIKANKRGERGLAMEPIYQGEPILAVAAVDEVTAADAIEKIKISYEPLPFVVDPFVSLRPGGPNARTDGNTWMRPPATGKGGPPPPLDLVEIKWTDEDFKDYDQGKMPMGKPTDQWTYGDVEGGFKNAALVLDETFMTPNTSHQCLETRTVMAYWQGRKLFVYAGTQSTIQTVPAIARWMSMSPDDIVLVSEYTGGGFGSKITASIHVIIPALLSKKCNAPVMMRISREEEHYIGRGRPSITGRIRAGFAADGRLTAVDMYSVLDNGPYDQAGDCNMSGRIVSLLYQAPAMRWRGISVLTNTTPRSAQSSPGGMQGITLMEPLMAKAARQLKIDQVELRRINAPEGKAEFGPPVGGKRGYTTSCFLKDALSRGADRFRWDERKATTGKRDGTKVRGIGVASSTFVAGSKGYDGLFVIRPDGKMYIQTGIGNLGTENFSDAQRVAAEIVGIPWEKVDLTWGNTSKNLPWSCASGGSQTTHAMTRAAHAAGMDAKSKLQEIAAKKHGGRPEDYEVAGERVYHKGGGGGMTLAQAAQQAIVLGGKYDGHELPPDINKMTVASAKALAGQGLMAVARDNYPQDGQNFSFVASFAEVEIDVETGSYKILDFLAVADVGTVIHPKALGGQILGRSMLGIAHAIGQKWVFDQHLGVPLAKRFYNNKPPTIMDAPLNMEWAALDIPDPEGPVGARGVGEPPVGGGCCAVLNAISDALGDEIFRRAPVTADVILTSLEAGKPVTETLTAHI